MNAIDKLSAAIEVALKEMPVAEVLAVLTGHFVGLTVELVRRQGLDGLGEIKLDGGSNRDITLHASKTAVPFTEHTVGEPSPNA